MILKNIEICSNRKEGEFDAPISNNIYECLSGVPYDS